MHTRLSRQGDGERARELRATAEELTACGYALRRAVHSIQQQAARDADDRSDKIQRLLIKYRRAGRS
jgi:hypothetical protein